MKRFGTATGPIMMRELLVAATFLGTGIALCVPTTAYAASGWSLYSDGYHPGPVSSSGSLSFNGRYSFDYDMNVRDWCPADGASAGVFFQIYPVGSGSPNTSKTFWDSNGCGPTGVAYVGTISRSFKIACVVVTLVWDDRGDTHGGEVVDGSNCKDNPNT